MQTARDLLELQQVDLEIHRDRKAIESIPEMTLIQEIRAKQKELARRTTKILGMLKDRRIEAEDNEGRRATLTRHVEEVKLDNSQSTDFRRIQNNNAELDRLAKRLEKVEFNQKKVLEEITRLEELMSQAQAIKDKLDARESELTATFKETAEGLRESLRELVARREALRERIEADLLASYDESCQKHGSIGVAELTGGACSVCRVELRPIQIDTLRQGPDIATCPMCGRMLVVRGGML